MPLRATAARPAPGLQFPPNRRVPPAPNGRSSHPTGRPTPMSIVDSVRGTIVRRVLLNYRIDPAAAQRALPAPFRPKLHRGFAVGGICLIRFRGLRPWFLPAAFGFRSENAAHRIAVEWDADGQTHEGVFVPRRDTDAWFQQAFGGRLFPGIHHRSEFLVQDDTAAIDLRVVRDDGGEELAFAAGPAADVAAGSVFASVAEASDFLRRGAIGYSGTARPGHFEGIRLECGEWQLEPLAVHHVRSQFFDDPARFPAGSVQLDSAFVLRELEHTWHGEPDLTAAGVRGLPRRSRSLTRATFALRA